nr:unnamed protein product [Callosobruchus chinensis]
MGTPGDKCRRPAAGETGGGGGGGPTSPAPPPAAVVKDEPPPSPSAILTLPPPVAMGVQSLSPPIAGKPVLGGFTPPLLLPRLVTPSGKPVTFLSPSGTVQQEPLQQLVEQQPPRTIEDYFQQSKFYLPPGAVTTSTAATVASPPPQQQQAEVRASPSTSTTDQPGPSGLQRSGASRGGHKLKQHQALHRQFACHSCHRFFSSQDRLNRHQQSHSGSCPFKCEQCKKTFTSKFKLVRHALIHSDRRPFSCSVCDRTFHRKDHLKNHIKVHSPQKETYTCNQVGCKKQYTSYLSYRKHLAVHSAESGNLTCQICFESSFATKEEILYHLKIHAGSRTVKNPAEKKFTCDYCDRKFFTKKDVRRHLVVHTGMRDFLCQFCPQRFGRKDHLVRHIKKSHHQQHQKEETTPGEPSVQASPVKVEIGGEQQQRPVEGAAGVQVKTEAVPIPAVPAAAADTMLQHYHQHSAASLVQEFGLKIFDEDFPAFLGGAGGGESSGEGSGASGSIFLPSTSQQLEELKDLGEGVLEEIEGPSTAEDISALPSGEEEEVPSTSTSAVFPPHAGEVLLDSPQLFRRLLEPTQEKNIPLPGFRQTFQHSQQQQPPQSPGGSARHQQPPPPT